MCARARVCATLTIVCRAEFQADKLFRRVCESAFQDAMWRNAREAAFSTFPSFHVATCTSPSLSGTRVPFSYNYFFSPRDTVQHGTRVRMSQDGRPARPARLLLFYYRERHVESINSSEEKRAATGGTNCAQKSIRIRDPRANK